MEELTSYFEPVQRIKCLIAFDFHVESFSSFPFLQAYITVNAVIQTYECVKNANKSLLEMHYSAATIFFTYLPTPLHSIIVPLCIAEGRAVSKIMFFSAVSISIYVQSPLATLLSKERP